MAFGGGIQRDQFQKHHHYINIKTASGGADVYGQSNYGAGSGPQYSSVGEAIQFDPQVGPPRSGDKTHPQNVTGVWTIQAFGAVTNPGSVDAAQLASDYAALNAAFQTMRGQVFGFNQTWQNVTASRSLGVIYTNTTGRPILVQVYTTSTAAAGYLFFAIDETPAGLVYYQNSAANLPGCILVPAGSTYRASTTNASLSGWREYR